MHELLDHLDDRAKAWAALIGGAILFFIESGLQVSGYTNQLLAIVLWGVAFVLCIYWLHYVTPKSWLKAWRVRMASWPFITMAFLVAFLAVGAGGYGLGLRAAQPAQQSPAEPVGAPNDIPGVPATRAGLSRGLDIIMPELLTLINGDGMKVRESFLSLSSEAPALLTKQGREVATSRTAATANALRQFYQKLASFREKYSLDSAWIDWIIGKDDEFMRGTVNSVYQLRDVLERITLPPDYSPEMLLMFWRGGQDTVSVPKQAADFGNWLSNMRDRIRQARDQFDKKLASNPS